MEEEVIETEFQVCDPFENENKTQLKIEFDEEPDIKEELIKNDNFQTMQHE